MANYRKKSSHSYGKRKQKSFAWIWLLTGMILGMVSVIYTYPLWQNGFSFDSLKRFTVARGASSASQDAGVALEQKVIIKKKKPEAQQYEFYTMLPDMEVALPKEKSTSTHPPIVQTKSEPIPVIIKAEEKNKPTMHSPKVGTKPIVQQEGYPTATHSKPIVQGNTVQDHKAGVTNKMVKQVPADLNKPKAAEYLIQAGMYRSAKEADGLKARLALLGLNARLQKIDAENGLWFRVIMGPFTSESLALAQQKKLEKHHIKAVLVMQRKLR